MSLRFEILDRNLLQMRIQCTRNQIDFRDPSLKERDPHPFCLCGAWFSTSPKRDVQSRFFKPGEFFLSFFSLASLAENFTMEVFTPIPLGGV